MRRNPPFYRGEFLYSIRSASDERVMLALANYKVNQHLHQYSHTFHYIGSALEPE